MMLFGPHRQKSVGGFGYWKNNGSNQWDAVIDSVISKVGCMHGYVLFLSLSIVVYIVKSTENCAYKIS